ncbi:hypothetical protein [Alteromonas alba]|jgi:hypothetical protein|uniref:hypothetical protein n=1 Tax=Alteromonas alba TaxID=2079529 RepID=UPI001478F233|nr:hypothetical protein [Alteromonas alba]
MKPGHFVIKSAKDRYSENTTVPSTRVTEDQKKQCKNRRKWEDVQLARELGLSYSDIN